jgi:uncharacterized protein (TIGR03437 family)
MGYPESTIVGIGIALLACTALYVVPRASVLDAVLLTGYLGGAVASNVRAGRLRRFCGHSECENGREDRETVNAQTVRRAGVLATLLIGLPIEGQTWDTSGNGMLNGTYYFRDVGWQGRYDKTNNLQLAEATYGTIVFNNGTYTISNANEFDSTAEAILPFSANGTYSVGANGYGFLSSPLVDGINVSILVSSTSGVVVGSTTNGAGYNDLFIAAPATSQTSSGFSGTYSMIGLDDPTLSVADTRVYGFNLTAGNASTQLSGYLAIKGGSVTSQTLSNLKFVYSNHAEAVNFGSDLTIYNVDTDLIGGTKYFYLSPDGNFIFGGSPAGWDFIVGVRQSVAGNFSGLYYTAGMSQDDSPANTSSFVNLYSEYGTAEAMANGVLLAHQRVLETSPGGIRPYDYTYTDSVTGSGATFNDLLNQYFFSSGGTFGIGFEGLEKGTSLGVKVLVQAPPAAQAGGVFINPAGVVNAGSLAPFTARWAPGELVSIYGMNLAPRTASDGSLPTTLSGVQVLVNGAPAPILFISPGQINAVIPLSLNASTTPVATIQVRNQGVPSNTIYNYVSQTQPGVFNSAGNLPAVQHADYSMVSSSSPAQIGETLLVYLTGLGQVDSGGNATNVITASIGGVPATIQFVGTGSAVGGSYQMNVTVPSGIGPGNAYLSISGPDSFNSSTMLPIGTSKAAARH